MLIFFFNMEKIFNTVWHKNVFNKLTDLKNKIEIVKTIESTISQTEISKSKSKTVPLLPVKFF